MGVDFRPLQNEKAGWPAASPNAQKKRWPRRGKCPHLPQNNFQRPRWCPPFRLQACRIKDKASAPRAL